MSTATAESFLAPGVPLLTVDEWEALSPELQEAYLAIVADIEAAWRLQPHQAWAEALADVLDEVLYGGAVGGGKSELIIWRAHHLSMQVPNHRSLVLRSTFPELRRSLILRSILRIPNSKATYKVGEREWHYPNGSVIEFGHCDSIEDTQIYLSAEYQAVFFDEATLFTAEQVTMVGSRLRSTRDQTAAGARPHLFLTTNPGGPGHAYFKRRYVDATQKGAHIAIWSTDTDPDDPSGRPIDLISLPPRPTHTHDWGAVERLREVMGQLPALDEETEIAVAFVPSTLDQNAYIDKGYRRRINALPALQRRQAYGDWDVFKGQYWSEWNPSVHVCAPFEPPADWERAIGIDYGFSPGAFCCLWVAWDQDGEAWIYREMYVHRVIASDQATQVLALSKTQNDRGEPVDERIRWRVADPSVFTNTGAGDPISRQWAKRGLHVKKANNARIDGWSNVREYMQVREDDGTSRLHVMTCCPNLIRTIPDMLHSKTNPEDMDTKGEDHALDALRYALAVRPSSRRPMRRQRRGSTLAEVESAHLANVTRQGRRRMNPWRTS